MSNDLTWTPMRVEERYPDHKVGALVHTKFSGRTTVHRITERHNGRRCQGGVLLRVEPEVPGSRDRDNPWDDGLISVCWFEVVGEQQELLL